MKRLRGAPWQQQKELRHAMLSTMQETTPMILISILWTQAAYLIIFLSLHTAWLAVPVSLDAVAAFIRLLSRRDRRGHTQVRRGMQDLNILATTLWIVLVAGQSFVLLHIRDVETIALGCILGVGFLGYVSARFAAFPGVAMLMICVLTLAVTAGLLTSPFTELMRLGMMAPAGGVAFSMLMEHAHDHLMEAIRAKHDNRQRSLHDPLTGLPNRLMLTEHLADLCHDRQHRLARPKSFAVLYMDLDGFKPVNDRHGHAAGDDVLISVAKILVAEVAGVGSAFRIGGDEFVLVLQAADRRTVAAIADRLIEAVAHPLPLSGGGETSVGATIGAALYPQHGTSQDALLSCADKALYEAKRAGKGQWSFGVLPPVPLAAAAA